MRQQKIKTFIDSCCKTVVIRQKNCLSKRDVFMFLKLFLLRLALTGTGKKIEREYSVGAATKLINNFCVNDLLKFVDSENNIIKLVNNEKRIKYATRNFPGQWRFPRNRGISIIVPCTTYKRLCREKL